jgi:hypothetical protein
VLGDVVDPRGLGKEGLQPLCGSGFVDEAGRILRDDVDLLARVPIEALLGDVARRLGVRAGGVVIGVEVPGEGRADTDDHDHGHQPEQDHAAAAAVGDVSETR